MKHNDFGEKIGGARKDLWGKRGLHTEDLLEMNDRELRKHVTKQNVWMPNYELMFQDGYDIDVIRMVKLLYDSIDKRPDFSTDPEKAKNQSETFINQIRVFKDACLESQTYSDAVLNIKGFISDNEIIKEPERPLGLYRINYILKNKGNPFVNYNIGKYFVYLDRDIARFRAVAERYANKKQLLIPADLKIPAGYTIRKFTKDNVETYKVYKSGTRIGEDHDSYDAALKFAKMMSKDSRTKVQRYTPPQLMTIRRDGPAFRRNNAHVTGKRLMEKFDFRGGEFGNWLTDADRQISLDMAYDSLMDLARATNLSYKAIGLNKELAIAFGSRGRSRALAHYEPERKVINLTKLKGAGSLAHEWFHALDDYLGTKFKTSELLSNNSSLYEPMANLIYSFQGTSFYRQSQSMDAQEGRIDQPYWSTNHEMCARAFACYIAHKLDYHSDYIVGHANLSPAIPTGDEATRIYEKFDALFEAITRDHYLEKDDHNAELLHEQETETTVSLVNDNSMFIIESEVDEMDVSSGEQISLEDILPYIVVAGIEQAIDSKIEDSIEIST